MDFFFWWPCGIWPHKNTPYSKALGAELSTCPKKVTWLGFKCKLGLISIQRSWRVVGGLVHISPNIYLTKLQRRKNLQLPNQFSHLLEKLESWVFPAMVSIINIGTKGKMTKILLHDEWKCITMMHYNCQPWACCIPFTGVMICCIPLSNYHHWMHF